MSVYSVLAVALDLDSCALCTYSSKCRKCPVTTTRLLLDHILSPCDARHVRRRSSLHQRSQVKTPWCLRLQHIFTHGGRSHRINWSRGSVHQMFRQLTAGSFSGAYTWCCLSCQSKGRNVDLIYKMHYKALFMMLPSWAYCLCVLLSLERSFSVDIYQAMISVKMPAMVGTYICMNMY